MLMLLWAVGPGSDNGSSRYLDSTRLSCPARLRRTTRHARISPPMNCGSAGACSCGPRGGSVPSTSSREGGRKLSTRAASRHANSEAGAGRATSSAPRRVTA
jgi:hypothetical protein